MRNNPKKFWNTLKQGADKKSSVNSCNLSGTDWFNYFKGLFTSQTAEADDPPILDNNRQDNVCDMLNLPISDQEIRESVYSLKSDKSPGPDGICAEIYKITLDYMCPYIRLMFNNFFDRGEVPDSFGESIISPIHKSGSFDVPGNFRGISLINTLCKIFMGIMNTRLQNW